MDEQTPDQTPPVWSLFRTDPAWKALYSLYNPDNLQGKSAGLQFSLQNRQALQKRVAQRAAATAAAAAAATRAAEQQKKTSPQKKKVSVPHFRQQQSQDVPDPLAAVPRRRTGQAIQAAMAADAQQAWGQVPLPSGWLIDEQEKQRCALLMQFKGNIPCPSQQLTPAGMAKVAAAAARYGSSSSSSSSSSQCCRDASSGAQCAQQQANSAVIITSRLASQRANLQQRFEEVEQEVAEREEFVASMSKLGRLQQEQLSAMRAEASAKVKEMRELDQQIRDLDAQLREHYSQDS